EGGAVADGDDAEAGRQRLDAVAVAHPHLLLAARRPQPVKEPALAGHLDEGAAEFAVIRGSDDAAELRAHRLLAVADAEHRYPHLEDDLRRQRRRCLVDRGGTA